jgi:hypothetical protein
VLHQHNEALDTVLARPPPRFHRYDQLPPSPHADDLLQEIDRGPTAIFWG